LDFSIDEDRIGRLGNGKDYIVHTVIRCDAVGMAGGQGLRHESSILFDVREGPYGVVRLNVEIREVEIGLRAQLFSKGHIDIVLKIICSVLWLVGIDDGVDVVKGKVEKSIIPGKVLLDLLGSGASAVGVCGVIARPNCDYCLLVEVGGELADDVILCAQRRTEPSAHPQFVELADDVRHRGPMLFGALNQI
jgi:hypothetical protein